MPTRSLRSSNGSRRPSLLTIAGNLISTVSNVLKRSPHFSHSRRRRIVEPSSETRESITRVSSCWQKGQCIQSAEKGQCSAIDRKRLALRGDLFAHPADERSVAGLVEHIADPPGELDALLLAVA